MVMKSITLVKTVIENLKEPVSSTLGFGLLLFLIYNFFTHVPRELSIYEFFIALTLAGVLAFGNPKAFFGKLSDTILNKFSSH